jgi:nitronate monooxygenase
MTLSTAFTERFALRHPIVLAPMARSAGGALAAAVSEGGGLGLIGGGYGDDVAWLDRELAIVAAGTDRPWGVGFLCWAASADAVSLALEYRPSVVLLSFGEPEALAAPVLAAGVPLIVMVTDLTEAQHALDIGADVVVAQGTEAGGHGGGRATLPFVPAVVDIAGDVPVLAAGGIADGRGLAAALALGAAGALVGTRFQASLESLAPAAITKALIAGHGEDTERTTLLDIARDYAWPTPYTGRALRNRFTDEWRGRADELRGDAEARAVYQAAVARGDLDAAAVWAGEGVDLITDLLPAAELVRRIAAEAEQSLRRASAAIRP